jgi:hypothetical protein
MIVELQYVQMDVCIWHLYSSIPLSFQNLLYLYDIKMKLYIKERKVI